MNGEDRVIRRVVVHGRVQGIGYRAWTEREALLRGIEGWVRNRRDGSVEALFAGPAERVDAMIDACRRGPLLSRVNQVDVQEARATDLSERRPGERFSMLPTV